jgi:hypothetical protein
MEQPGSTESAGVLPVAQLACCVLATGLGFVLIGDELSHSASPWPGVGLGLVGLAATVIVWRSPAGRGSRPTYLGGVLVPVVLLVVVGLNIFTVFALLVLVATVVDVVRDRLAARERRR